MRQEVKEADKKRILSLLQRPCPLSADADIKHVIENHVVLVTGGGGSIGSELCRQIAAFSPRQLLILDIYENAAYELQIQLKEEYPTMDIPVLIASVRDLPRMKQVFSEFRPTLVFHAAAHKHVPLMEDNPAEAIKNNVFGTKNVAECALEFGAERFVLLSTDKAANPAGVMGASKRLSERIIETMQQPIGTVFSAVRFGNVLDSNGSVLPLFRRQIQKGGPVTVTDPRVTRFFMTIPEAVGLVLKAACYAKGGEVFLLEMGEQLNIDLLARCMIEQAGKIPDEEISIVYTGLRAGEKLHEELQSDRESLVSTDHDKIKVIQPHAASVDSLNRVLLQLEAAVSFPKDEIRSVLLKAVSDLEQDEVPIHIKSFC